METEIKMQESLVHSPKYAYQMIVLLLATAGAQFFIYVDFTEPWLLPSVLWLATFIFLAGIIWYFEQKNSLRVDSDNTKSRSFVIFHFWAFLILIGCMSGMSYSARNCTDCFIPTFTISGIFFSWLTLAFIVSFGFKFIKNRYAIDRKTKLSILIAICGVPFFAIAMLLK